MSAIFLKAVEANYVVAETPFASGHVGHTPSLHPGLLLAQGQDRQGIALRQEVNNDWGIPSHASAEGASNTLKTGGACASEGSQRSRVVPSECEDQGLSAASVSERAQQGNVHVGEESTTGNDCPLEEGAHATTSTRGTNVTTLLRGMTMTSKRATIAHLVTQLLRRLQTLSGMLTFPTYMLTTVEHHRASYNASLCKLLYRSKLFRNERKNTTTSESFVSKA